MLLKGSMVALVTPMRADGTIDMPSMQALVDWHIQSGTHAVVILGTTGEAPVIEEKERTEIIRQTIHWVNGRIPVIVGTGTHSTQQSIRFTKQAADLGADACLLVTPYYNKPTQEGLYAHYQSIAEHVGVPQILYNVPGRTACDLLPDTVARLSLLDNIIGIKEATPGVDRLRALQSRCNDDFLLISGDDGSCADFVLEGGQGVISVTANVVPDKMSGMLTAAMQGRLEEARQLNAALEDLHRVLFVETNPIPVKWALSSLGKMPAGIRLPLTPLSGGCHSRVSAALKKVRGD